MNLIPLFVYAKQYAFQKDLCIYTYTENLDPPIKRQLVLHVQPKSQSTDTSVLRSHIQVYNSQDVSQDYPLVMCVPGLLPKDTKINLEARSCRSWSPGSGVVLLSLQVLLSGAVPEVHTRRQTTCDLYIRIRPRATSQSPKMFSDLQDLLLDVVQWMLRSGRLALPT